MIAGMFDIRIGQEFGLIVRSETSLRAIAVVE